MYDNATKVFSELKIVPGNTLQGELLHFIRSAQNRTESVADAEVDIKSIDG